MTEYQSNYQITKKYENNKGGLITSSNHVKTKKGIGFRHSSIETWKKSGGKDVRLPLKDVKQKRQRIIKPHLETNDRLSGSTTSLPDAPGAKTKLP